MKIHFTNASFLDLSLEAIDRISRAEENEYYPIFCRTLGEGFKWDYGEVWIRDTIKPLLIKSDINYTTDERSEIFARAPKRASFAYGEGFPGIAWEAKKIVWFSDFLHNKQFIRSKEAMKAGFKTCCAIPVLAENYVDAVILFFSRKPLEENTKLNKLLEILSSKIGTHILKKQLAGLVENYREEASRNIELISKIFSLRDPYTITHEIFVKRLAVDIGKKLEFSAKQLQDLSFAATLHDIGKIAIPMEILSKPSKLTVEELNLVRTHVIAGYNIIKDLKFSDDVKRMVYEHHERLDGSGYPQGLRGDQIFFGSQLLAVTDVVSAMMENRPYRPAHSKETVIEELTKYSNIKYNPAIVDIALGLLNEYPQDYFKQRTLPSSS